MAIQTFIFFDLETTGLPDQENNKTKITELAFVAVSRSDIENGVLTELPLTSKLSILFNPERPIQPMSSKITGLTNKCLERQPLFKDKIICINNFLDLPKPVCLVAHNGNKFDYKILNAEYNDVNASLPNELKCIDSLNGFKEILKKHTKNKNECTSLDLQDDSNWPALDITPEEWKDIDELESFSQLSITPKKEKSKPSAPESYKLPVLYKYLTDEEPIGSHRAEADCIMLLKCAIALKNDFLKWADENYIDINKVKPLSRK